MLVSGTAFCITVTARTHLPVDELCIGLSIRDRLGQTMFGTNTYHHSKLRRDLLENTLVVTRFNLTAHLGEGQYLLSVSAHRGAVHTEGNYDWLDNCLAFDVINSGLPNYIGSCNLAARVEVDASVVGPLVLTNVNPSAAPQ